MIHFTRLKLAGFKSFVEPTEVVIEPGLTGVVGPNGCGKSNLVEALRWVMGETSSKGMRATGMDDVIFAGSGRRPARNIAEVSLRLDNAAREAPADFNAFDDIEVARRIERGAGSDYRINGKSARARDVQILFADSSTGARSPALVRQGQVSELIGAKPSARRMILEEAAGVSGLHARRHEAELRLRAAEQNLERLADVLSELDRQVDALTRQARQARRYRTLSADIRSTEASLFHVRWRSAVDAATAAAQEVEAARRRVAEAAQAQAAAARAEAVAAHAVPGARDAEAKANEGLQAVRAAIQHAEGETTRANEKLKALERQHADVLKDLEREGALAEDAAKALAALDREADDLDRQLEGADERLAALEARAREAAEALAAAEPVAKAAIAAEAEARARAEALSSALAAAERTREKAAAELAAAEAAHGRAGAAASAARSEAEAEAVTAAVAALAAAEEEVTAAEAAAAAAREAERAAEAEASRRAAALSAHEAEARATRRFLGEDGDRRKGPPPALDMMTVSPGYEVALAASLGEDLDAPVAADAPIAWTGSDGTGDPPLPDGAAPLSGFVEAPAELARRLAQVGVVEGEDGPTLAPRLKPGQRIVTADGAVWRWDGLVAAAGAPSAAARRLEARNRLAEIEREIARTREALAGARAAHGAAREALSAAGSREKAAREAVKEARRRESSAREALSRAELAAEAAAAEVRRTAAAVEAARTRLGEADAALAEARAAAADAPSLDALREARAAAEADLAVRREAAAAARAGHDGQARQVEARRRRRARIDEERRGWHGRLSATDGRGDALQNRRAAVETEREALAARLPELQLASRRLHGELKEAEAALAAAADRRVAAEGEAAETARAAKAAVEALSAAREAAARAEERDGTAAARLAEIVAEVEARFETAPTGLAALAGLSDDQPLPDEEATRKRLERLSAERERLGGVNLRAEEELSELEGRRATILAERDDLVAAIDKLRAGLSTINREARQRLLAAFETVDANFRRLFTHLFGGGEASLKLVDAEDPLEAGLDIEARPPGKKPQSLGLLSGGEQALTATALVFAVFLTNPAPICVLDEVDAPLDDANVTRFCALLDEMTRLTETRFLVITHNPITMAHMHRLYGVTMAERGVSQLVSVSLEAAVELREAV